MKRFYSVCGQSICIDAPSFPGDCRDFDLFRVEPCSADILVNCHVTDDFPEMPVNSVKSTTDVDVTVGSDGGYTYRKVDMGRSKGVLVRISEGGSPAECFFTEESFSVMFGTRYMWNSLALGQLLLPKNALLFHSSYIGISGGAVLFSAKSGVGKSTQAALWEKHKGAKVINGDKAGVLLKDGEVFACGVPFCGTSGICNNVTLPLKAIVLLEQGSTDTLKRENGASLIQKLASNIYLDFILSGETGKSVDLLLEIIKRVPVYTLRCTPEKSAVDVLAGELNL